jgi:methionyl-tRNA formyltransferase
MRIALCVKRDVFGLLALRTVLPFLQGSALRVFCSVKTRPDETAVRELTLLKTLERDFPMDVLLPLAPPGDMPAPAEWEELPDLAPTGGAARLLDFAPDLVLSLRFSLIFRQGLIARIPQGIINVHPGRLPGYRGLYAPFWQALAGEPEFGCTVHFVDARIDTGPVIGEARVRRDPARSLFWHTAQLYRGGAAIAGAAAAGILRGKRPEAAGQPPGGRYFRLPGPGDFAALAETGFTLVTPADYLDCLREILAPAPAIQGAAA